MSGLDARSSQLANGSSSQKPQTPAATVGNQFVSQFYVVLHSSPRYLHRFYTDDSTVTYADCGSDTDPATCITVSTQKDINERVSQMGFEEAVTEIWSVDSQYSQNNGVQVVVTGSLQCKGKKKRDFVQCFFLAVQEKGYYVLNDTFRYLADRSPKSDQFPKESYTSHQAPVVQGHSSFYAGQPPYPGPLYPQPLYPAGPALTQPLAAVVPQLGVQAASSTMQSGHVPPKIKSAPTGPPAAAPPPQPVKSATPPTDSSSKPAGDVGQIQPSPSPANGPTLPASKTEASAGSMGHTKPGERKQPARELVPPSSKLNEAPPMKPEVSPAPAVPLTYADRLKLGTQGAPAQLARPALIDAKTPEPTSASSLGGRLAEPEILSSTSASLTNGAPSAKEDDSLTASIFVRNLPEEITAEKLEQVFSQFGKIRGGLQGVSLRQQKGKGDFAFVQFEESSSMQAAVDAKVSIDDKLVGIMERKPLLAKGGRSFGSDRAGRGEGRGFRSNGRSERGRGSRAEARPQTGGRDRPEGREGQGGRGRGYNANFIGSERGRGERGRGRTQSRPVSNTAPLTRAPAAISTSI